MNRRELFALLGGAAAPLVLAPLAARAQQPERVRHVGVLMSQSTDDQVAQTRYAAFLQGLQRSGWEVGRNVRIETRWAAGSTDNTRKSASELVALAPDVILATGSASTGPLLQATRSVPIVFVHTPDPLGAGYVNSMSRPGGNVTGFINFEYGIGAKWLELLKQIMPSTTRAAIVRDPTITAGIGMWGAIQAAAPSLGIEAIPVNIHDVGETERALAAFARSSHGGLIVTGSALAVTNRELIVSLAARHKLPTVYFERFFVTAGGLASYGPDLVEQYRQAAGYVDRILRGAKPADLPVQAPTRYELVLNLKTAKALDLEVPTALLARADEVIE
jgi:putative tryptophan/tyrosine transport system substrate-binding protein